MPKKKKEKNGREDKFKILKMMPETLLKLKNLLKTQSFHQSKNPKSSPNPF